MRADLGERKAYWWDESVSEEKSFEAVTESVRWLDKHQSYRRDAILDAVRLYGNYDALGLSGAEYARARDRSALRLKWNLIKSVTDTLVALLATQRTRPMFLTSRGDYDQQERAKKLNRFAAGQLYGTRFYHDVGPKAFRDAALFGKGFAKIFRRGNDVAAERVFPGDMLVDDIEARDGQPRQLFHVREVAREVLYAHPVFGEHEDAIYKARLIRNESAAHRSMISDAVNVIEAWHLPSEPGEDDGRHVICTSAGTLVDESWSRAFPFATIGWGNPILGWWPPSLISEIDGTQVEINYLLLKIQRLMTLATSQLWAQKGSNINAARISNEDWAINEYEGVMPQVLNMQSASPEFFSHLDRLWQRGFELVGISQLAAQAKKPGGLNSGEALRQYKDAQSQRFVDVEQSYERFHLDAVEIMIDQAKEIDEDGDGGYQILAKGDRDAEVIKWGDVRLDRDKYVLQAFPTSFLPTEPAGRMQAASELIDRFPQLQPYAMQLLGFPDLDAAVAAANSATTYCDLLISEALEHGRYHPPQPEADLALNIKRMNERYLQGLVDGVPEERLELLLRYMTEAKTLLSTQAAPPAVPGATAPPPSGPAPMPAPAPMMPPAAA